MIALSSITMSWRGSSRGIGSTVSHTNPSSGAVVWGIAQFPQQPGPPRPSRAATRTSTRAGQLVRHRTTALPVMSTRLGATGVRVTTTSSRIAFPVGRVTVTWTLSGRM